LVANVFKLPVICVFPLICAEVPVNNDPEIVPVVVTPELNVFDPDTICAVSSVTTSVNVVRAPALLKKFKVVPVTYKMPPPEKVPDGVVDAVLIKTQPAPPAKFDDEPAKDTL